MTTIVNTTKASQALDEAISCLRAALASADPVAAIVIAGLLKDSTELWRSTSLLLSALEDRT
jgi:hypothetical protein